MNLFQNPFYILGVSTRATNQEIYEAYDNLILSKDPELCRNARTILTHPRKKLSAEIAWLPGLSPSKSIDLINKIKSDRKHVVDSFPSLPPLSRCNLITSFLIHKTPANLHEWIHHIAKIFDSVDNNRVMRLINEDRTVASIPLIQDLGQIENELQNHFNFIVGAMRDCLNRLPDPDIIFTKVVQKATLDGSEQAPAMIDTLADFYQSEVQRYLNQLYEEIVSICNNISETAKNGRDVYALLGTLDQKVRAWDQIGQPIQLIMWSRGKEDEHSLSLAGDLRNLGIFLANELGLHHEAKEISDIMSDVFKELPDFSEKVSEDIAILDDIIDQKEQQIADYEKWKKEISLDIDIGKDRLSISAEYISYKKQSIVLKDVTKIRWGIYKRYTNYVRNQRQYTIWLGTPRSTMEIECVRFLEKDSKVEQRFTLIVDKLWKAVCARLFSDILTKLSSGEKIRFGEALVDSNGVSLKRHKWIGTDEPFYSRWEDLTISNGSGTFIISSSNEKKTYAELAYRDVDNVHILEAIMRFLWKDGNYARLQRGEFSEDQ